MRFLSCRTCAALLWKPSSLLDAYQRVNYGDMHNWISHCKNWFVARNMLSTDVPKNCNRGGDTRHDSHPCGWWKEFLRHFYVSQNTSKVILSNNKLGWFYGSFNLLISRNLSIRNRIDKSFCTIQSSASLFVRLLHKSAEFPPGRFPHWKKKWKLKWCPDEKKLEFPIDWIGIIGF